MKDDKKLNDLSLSKDELSEAVDKTAVTEDNFSVAVDKTKDYSDKELAEELERLAENFQNELKKAQAMSEEELIKSGLIIQQYEDEDGVIPEEELCQCCGEQRRDKTFGENYAYCRDCREAMRKYPLGVGGILTLAAMVFVAVVSVFSFAADFDIYNTVRQGDAFIRENKLYSALDSYDSAISAMEEREIVPKKLYLKTAGILFSSMPNGMYSMTEIKSNIESALTQFEIQIPLYANYKEMHREVQVLYGTLNEFYTLMNDEKYAEYDFKEDTDYEEAMTEIGSIIDKRITVTSVDKETSELAESSEAAVRFCQYMFAYGNGRYDDSYQYMNLVYELEPSYLWLYAYELGMADLQKGNTERTEMFAKAMYENNCEAPDGYALYSAMYRMTGKAEKAVEWVDRGLKVNPESTELLRLKAMAYIADGDYEKAKEATDKAREYESYGLLYMVAMVAENELGNKDNVESLQEFLDENDIELSEKMQKYFDGKITAQQMFTEGTGDVE